MLLATVILACFGTVLSLDPTCDKPVYCDSDLLQYVQLARLYNDSKTFVDLRLLQDETTTLAAFDALLNETDSNPSASDLTDFIAEYFADGDELEEWTPTDYSDSPSYVSNIVDEDFQQFALDLNALWLILGRKVKEEVFANPDVFSFVPVTHGFMIPGGRFKELYYWDTYWIIKGLLISDMTATAKGMIENFFELLAKLGKVPNGSRWYYQRRSQPPLLTAMVKLYVDKTGDTEFLSTYIDAMEAEMDFWLSNHTVDFKKGRENYVLLRYYAPTTGPRPESYYEDYSYGVNITDADQQSEFYTNIKSAAESGLDFSSRWFKDENGSNEGNLSTIHTIDILPVDLNSIFANALQNIADFHTTLNNKKESASWSYLARKWRRAIESVFWNKDVGVWLDYDYVAQKHRNYFYPSNVAPVWMRAVEPKFLKRNRKNILKYLKNSTALDFPGGIPSSLLESGQQWDFPNAWPPAVSYVVNVLEDLGISESKDLAFEIAQRWVRANYKGFVTYGQMFEKYDAVNAGEYGGGGEYTVQSGFGWSNGVVIEFLDKYGDRLSDSDS